jgi:hypothetical protein
MRGIVLGERTDPEVWNDDTEQWRALQGGERRDQSGIRWNRALRRTRRHSMVGAAALTIVPIGKGLTATRVGDRIPDAFAQGRGIGQSRTLGDRGQEQNDDEEATGHAWKSVP